MTIEDYILEHTEEEPEYLYRLWRKTNIHLLHGRMASGHLQGRFLKMLVRMIRPKRILEVGTFTGYSALAMAEGLAEGAKVMTFEINDELEPFTRPLIEQSPWHDKVEFYIGDANILAPEMAKKGGFLFDMAFIDGDKRTYIKTFQTALSLVRAGGFIAVDNTLWDSHVVDHAYDRDQQTLAIEQFNDYVQREERVFNVLLPLRDGLTLIEKL